MPKLTFVYAILVFSMIACVSSGVTHPDWVEGNSAKYNNNQYLVGRGQAQSQEQAQNRARADLAKIFSVAIYAASEDSESYVNSSGNTTDSNGSHSNAGGKPNGNTGGVVTGNAKSQTDSEISRTLSTQMQNIVEGSQVAEIWQDPMSKQYYALAVMPRTQTAVKLRQDIARLDDATSSDIARAQRTPDLFHKIAAASHALNMQQERAGAQKTLQIVDTSGQGIEPVWSITKLSADLDALLRRVHIASQVDNHTQDAAELGSIVAGALANAGFSVPVSENTDYLLITTLRLENPNLQEGWYWVRGALEIKLYAHKDQALTHVLGARRWNIKAASQEQTLARRRALEQVDSLLKEQLRHTIIGFSS